MHKGEMGDYYFTKYHHSIPSYWSCSNSKRGIARGSYRTSVSQLPAHHVGVLHTPVGLADGAPRSVVEDLHPALISSVAIHQTNQRVGGCVCVHCGTCVSECWEGRMLIEHEKTHQTNSVIHMHCVCVGVCGWSNQSCRSLYLNIQPLRPPRVNSY